MTARAFRTTALRYQWLGGKQREAELPSGVIQMGQRLYVPQVGRFTGVDPVEGGSANYYDYVNQDPLNALDLDGRRTGHESCQGYGPVRAGRCAEENDAKYHIRHNSLKETKRAITRAANSTVVKTGRTVYAIGKCG